MVGSADDCACGMAVYCLQELVANSITATKPNLRARNIQVCLHKHKHEDKYAITVHDNGSGMDKVRKACSVICIIHWSNFASWQSTLIEAFTHHLGRERRGYDIDRLEGGSGILFLDSVINRYGVGLKESAFALGDGLYVMTKQTKASQVLQCCMDRETLLARYKSNPAWAYERDTVSRNVACPQDDTKVLVQFDSNYESIIDMTLQEQDGAAFTTVVITDIKEFMVQQFRNLTTVDQGDQPTQELEIAHKLGSHYHFFMETPAAALLQQEPAARATRSRASRSGRSPQSTPDAMRRTPNCLRVPSDECAITLTVSTPDHPQPIDVKKVDHPLSKLIGTSDETN